MTERYKQQLQLISLEEYKTLLLAELTNQLRKIDDIQEFTKEEQEEYQAPTSDWLRIAKGQHSKIKVRTVTKILEEKYNATVQGIESSFLNLIDETFQQMQKKQEEIKEKYDPILSKISALDNLTLAEGSLGAAIIEVEKLAHLTSKESINIPTQKQSLETILASLQKVKSSLFDTEHYITTDPKIETYSQDQLINSDITTDYVSINSSEEIGNEVVTLLGKGVVLF